MHILGGLIGIVASFFIVKYREAIGDAVGDPDWAHKIGGIYNVIIIVGILIFFWGVAALTNTQDILLAPIVNFFPHGNR